MMPALRLFALVFALGCAATAAQAQGYSTAARQVIERARAASGGAGWYQIRGWHETAIQGGVRYETWIDPIRYGLRIESRGAAGLHVQGFNGAGEWRILPSGAATGAADAATLAQVRNAAFFGGAFYFYPGRYDARGRYLKVAKIGDRAFDVLEVTPFGGSPRELWFDRRTRLLGRIVDRTGPWPVVVELSDYRRVGPVLVPFRKSIDDAEPAGSRDRVVETLVFTTADRSIFSLPRPTNAAQDAQREAVSTTPASPAKAVRRLD